MLGSFSTMKRGRPLISRSLRHFSSSESSSTPAKTGAGLLQRLTSFMIGAGLTALASQYFIYEEVKAGNTVMLKKQSELESRVYNLEKKQSK